MRRLAVALALAGVAAASGCRTVLPFEGPLALDDPRPALWLARLDRLGTERHAVRATARVAIDGQRGASFAKQLVLVERPAKLRIEVLGLLGQRVAVLATDGADYQLYRASEGALETGMVQPSVLSDVAGLPLTPEEAVALLLGTPRSGVADTDASGAAGLEDGGVRVVLEDPPGAPSRSVEFDAEGNLRRYTLSDPDGELLVDVRYADFRVVGETLFAHEIALDFPSAAARAELAFRRVELNPELPSAVFRLEPLRSLPGSAN